MYQINPGESATSANQKRAWNAQASMQQQQRDSAWERGRELHERGLQMQEQSRRMQDSRTASDLGAMKYGVLSKLLGGKMGGKGNGGDYMRYYPQVAGRR